MDGKEQPFFLHSFMTSLGYPGYIARWVVRIGKGYKSLSISRAWSKKRESYERIVKESPTVPALRRHPKGDLYHCTVVGHLAHILLSIILHTFALPRVLALLGSPTNPGLLWLTPGSLPAALATVNRPRAEPKTCTKKRRMTEA
jgi:hypothetical protein